MDLKQAFILAIVSTLTLANAVTSETNKTHSDFKTHQVGPYDLIFQEVRLINRAMVLNFVNVFNPT